MEQSTLFFLCSVASGYCAAVPTVLFLRWQEWLRPFTKRHDDLDKTKQSIQASWSAYAWIMVILAVIALAGWVIGHYVMH